VLSEHPAVAEAAAVAVRSEIAGGEDEVKACVVLTPGQALSPEALLDFCQTRMPHFAVPRYVEFLAALPNAHGQGTEGDAAPERDHRRHLGSRGSRLPLAALIRHVCR
jgi:carnitine-CoA ligase